MYDKTLVQLRVEKDLT